MKIRDFLSFFLYVPRHSERIAVSNLNDFLEKKPPARQNNPNNVLKWKRNSGMLLLTQQGATMSKYTKLTTNYWRHCIKVSGKTKTRKRIQDTINKATGRRRDELIVIYLEVFNVRT